MHLEGLLRDPQRQELARIKAEGVPTARGLPLHEPRVELRQAHQHEPPGGLGVRELLRLHEGAAGALQPLRRPRQPQKQAAVVGGGRTGEEGRRRGRAGRRGAQQRQGAGSGRVLSDEHAVDIERCREEQVDGGGG